jgi:hypothetical protein
MPYKDKEKQKIAVKEAVNRYNQKQKALKANRPIPLYRKPTLEEMQVRTANDIIAQLNYNIMEVNNDRSLKSDTRAKTISNLCLVILRALEVGSLEGKVIELEERYERLMDRRADNGYQRLTNEA